MSKEKMEAMGASPEEMQALQSLGVDWSKLFEIIPQALAIVQDKTKTPFQKVIALALLLAPLFVQQPAPTPGPLP